MELYNSLTKQLDSVKPSEGKVRIYSCGPTVYERAHIGNLASFIYADTLRRALEVSGMQVEHVMNITDVDDKTIAKSQEKYPDLEPMEALKKLTGHYEELFMDDLTSVGVDTGKIEFVRATDNIETMQNLITKLLAGGVAYTADDGIYFSIDEYKRRGKVYGQLVSIEPSSAVRSRIDNDEYDKDNPQDFVLWKAQKLDEPAWDFEVDGKNIAGRPGWHIECSAMSTKFLGQPFEIHTGGVDLKFPHHENEIAQSTALNGEHLAKLFFHSEHMLIDSQKMSKSLNNFLTLEDIKNKGFDPLVFRLLVLQSRYDNQSHFSWKSLGSAKNSLRSIYDWVELRFQDSVELADSGEDTELMKFKSQLTVFIQNDLNTPLGLTELYKLILRDQPRRLSNAAYENLLPFLDRLFGLSLMKKQDIEPAQKSLISTREDARKNQDWAESDKLRDKLLEQGIGLNDTDYGTIWYRL